MAKAKIKKVYRSAVTGRFVTKKFVHKHPRTTERESVRVRR